jgi:2-hydroxychromene-2-carboxylate isomerase
MKSVTGFGCLNVSHMSFHSVKCASPKSGDPFAAPPWAGPSKQRSTNGVNSALTHLLKNKIYLAGIRAKASAEEIRQMSGVIDFWFDFASSYSYPAAMRIERLAQSRDVRLTWRPFLLGPIFVAQGWRSSPFNIYPAKGRYMWRDLQRVCEGEDLPLRRPNPFPQNSLLAARCALAIPDLKRAAFARAVFTAEFDKGLRIDEPETLAAILAQLDLPQSALADATTDRIKQELRLQTAEAQRLDLFGAPSFLTGGELFWGNDRLEQALEWASRS